MLETLEWVQVLLVGPFVGTPAPQMPSLTVLSYPLSPVSHALVSCSSSLTQGSLVWGLMSRQSSEWEPS